MSLIEQAAQRLEQLRKAGVDVPASPDGQAGPVIGEEGQRGVDRPADARPAEPREPQPRESAPTRMPETPLSRRVDVNLDVLAASGIIRPDASRSRQSDEFRVIKRPLIDNAMGKGAARLKDGNLIMVTSALPGEGKTFTALNLAVSIAMELDNTVMLVDADVARPTLLKKMGLAPAKGLLDVLVDESISLPQVLLKTNIEKLTVLPSGTQHPRATELLASEAMVRLLEEMSSRYSDRIIIFDSPPLLVTTEARALASHMGQVVMVVSAERTTHADVRNALAAIESCPVRLMLLNRAKAMGRDEYGYGYGYGYGYSSAG